MGAGKGHWGVVGMRLATPTYFCWFWKVPVKHPVKHRRPTSGVPQWETPTACPMDRQKESPMVGGTTGLIGRDQLGGVVWVYPRGLTIPLYCWIFILSIHSPHIFYFIFSVVDKNLIRYHNKDVPGTRRYEKPLLFSINPYPYEF